MAENVNSFNEEDNIDLINLILMLNQNALISLGEASRFVGGIKNQNLPHARQTINMLKAIRDKSKGNLTAGESKLIIKLLPELQSKYVKAAGLGKSSSNDSGAPPLSGKKSGGKTMEKALDNMSNSQLADILSRLQKKAYGNDK